MLKAAPERADVTSWWYSIRQAAWDGFTIRRSCIEWRLYAIHDRRSPYVIGDVKAVSSVRYLEWLDQAILQAEKSWSEGGIPIGSVLVDGRGKVVSRGHNERVQTGDPTAHAEVVCIRSAGRRRDWQTLTLVSTLSPCAMCSGTAVLLKIPRIIVGENQTFQGEEDWMRSRGADVRVLQDPRCVALMKRLQTEKPDLWAEDIGE